jgi:hypothetical protein
LDGRKGYHFEFDLGWGNESAAGLWAVIPNDPALFFPVPVGNCDFETGETCSLGPRQQIEVVDVGDVSMTLRSRNGHGEGSGNTITFQILETDSTTVIGPGGGWESHRLTLVVEAEGPYNGPVALWGGRALAYKLWRSFAFNLNSFQDNGQVIAS